MCKHKVYRTEAARIDQAIGAPLEGGELEVPIKGLAKSATPEILVALPADRRR